jgi:hypothetical protein
VPVTTPRRSGRRRNGQALTEFALVAPILFLLLFGVLQLGLLFGAQNGLVNGVREAARRAVTWRVNDASVQDASIYDVVCDAVRDELDSELSGGSLPGFQATRLHPAAGKASIVSYHWEANPGADPGTTDEQYFLFVEIDAAYDHPLYVPLVGIFFDALDGSSDNAFTLSASEQMRVENPSLAEGSPPPPCT